MSETVEREYEIIFEGIATFTAAVMVSAARDADALEDVITRLQMPSAASAAWSLHHGPVGWGPVGVKDVETGKVWVVQRGALVEMPAGSELEDTAEYPSLAEDSGAEKVYSTDTAYLDDLFARETAEQV